MWDKNTGNAKKVRLTNGKEMVYDESAREHKLSIIMAMILGVFLTIEIIAGSAMIFDFDLFRADKLAILLAFIVLYLGVVASLTDR